MTIRLPSFAEVAGGLLPPENTLVVSAERTNSSQNYERPGNTPTTLLPNAYSLPAEALLRRDHLSALLHVHSTLKSRRPFPLVAEHLISDVARTLPSELVDRIMSQLVTARCPVLYSLDAVTVAELALYLTGCSDDAVSLHSFITRSLRKHVNFRLYVKRLENAWGQPAIWYLCAASLSQLRGVRHLQLQCDSVTAHKRDILPPMACNIESMQEYFPNLSTITLHVTLRDVCGLSEGCLETGAYFHTEIAKLVDVIKHFCPGKQKFVRVRGRRLSGQIWYLPAVEIDSRPARELLGEAMEDMEVCICMQPPAVCPIHR